MRRMISHLMVQLFGLFAFTICLAAPPSLEVSIDRQTIRLDERVQVQVEVSTSADQPGRINVEGPSLDDWQVVGRFERTSYDGRTRQNATHFQLQLQPVRQGELTVGVFQLNIGGETLKSEPLKVTVLGLNSETDEDEEDNGGEETVAAQPSEDPVAFMEWEVDNKRAVVGQEIRARLYIYVTTRLVLEQLDPASFDFSGFWTIDHPSNQRPRGQTVQRGNALYTKTELASYHLFPIRAGNVEIPQIEAKLRLREASFFGRSRPIEVSRTAKSLPISISALPTNQRPKNFQGTAVGQLKLEAKLDRKKVTTEDGVQLSIKTSIQGLINHVPEISLPEMPEFRVFPPTSETNSEVKGEHVQGERRQTWLLRPLKPGTFTIPAIELAYFDPKSQTYKVAHTQPFTLEATGAAQEVAAPTQVEAPKNELTLRGLRPTIALDQIRSNGYADSWFIILVIAAPFAWICVIIAQSVHRNRRQTATARQAKQAANVARKALSRLNFEQSNVYSELQSILLNYLESRFNCPIRGLTAPKLAQLLLGQNVSQKAVDALQNELDHCDFARFAPSQSNPGSAKETRERMLAVIEQIEETQR